MSSLDEGFSYVAAADAKVLILGSMPGQASLEAQQYYAHPRNAFWPIMQELFGIDAKLAYQQRLEALVENNIALWDVVASCERPGSLDSAIVGDSILVNNFAAFYQTHPQVAAVFCNGGKAYELYSRHVTDKGQLVTKLPSTSPAHASMSFAEKLECWSAVREAL